MTHFFCLAMLFLLNMLAFVVWFVTPQPQSSVDNEGEEYLWWEGGGHSSVWKTHAWLVGQPC